VKWLTKNVSARTFARLLERILPKDIRAEVLFRGSIEADLASLTPEEFAREARAAGLTDEEAAQIRGGLVQHQKHPSADLADHGWRGARAVSARRTTRTAVPAAKPESSQ